MRAVVGLQILILQLATLALSFQLTARVTVPCLLFLILCLCSNTSRVDMSASLPDPKDQRIVAVVYTSITLQHFSNVTRPNILVDVVSSDHRVYSTNDLTFDSTLHAIACDDFTRSRNLVIGLLHRYNNCRYYCWAEKLMLCRNWASQTKHAVCT